MTDKRANVDVDSWGSRGIGIGTVSGPERVHASDIAKTLECRVSSFREQMGGQSRDTSRSPDGGAGPKDALPARGVRYLHGKGRAAAAAPQLRLGGGEAQLGGRLSRHARKVTLGFWFSFVYANN